MYGYEYFCGANVLVEIEGMPLMEAVGLSYQIAESKRPIYGYSSRHFDAVARGQVLVQGSLLINFVHQDYLYQAISLGRNPIPLQRPKGKGATLGDPNFKNAVTKEISKNYENSITLIEQLKDKYWEPLKTQEAKNEVSNIYSPHDHFGSLTIKAKFGDVQKYGGVGKTGIVLDGVYFTGRGLPIQIDENVIVEEYSFFARNVSTLSPVQKTIDETKTDDFNDLAEIEQTIITANPRNQ